ncbi:MAG TPA: HEAT repeat domain-containing protein [Planctomycetota bacterium]|jgi:HEAT repeat protein|nr:HEAT repeat domain-containing protein [Planctomycetota bacterium]
MLNALAILAFLAQQDDAAVKEALDRFKQGMKATSPAAQASAITELSRTPAEKTLNAIIPLVMDGPKETRIAAAKGLGNFTDYKKKATPALLAALAAGPNVREPDVVAAIYEGLGKLADPTSLDTVHKGFRNEQIPVAKAAIACSGAMKQKESMDVLIELLKDCQKWLKNKQGGPYKDAKGQNGDDNAVKTRVEDIQKEVIKAFQTITKEKWTTAMEWELWWSKHKATFEPSK